MSLLIVRPHHIVTRLAEIFNIAVVITNQVQSSPDTFFGDPTKAAGGNVIGHASTYRIYLRKSGENRTAKMIDSPYHPYSDARFTLNEKGTDDLEDEISSFEINNNRTKPCLPISWNKKCEFFETVY
jgi:DNA repair protein RadA